MSKRSRRDPDTSDGSERTVDPALAAFAAFVRSEEEKERAEKRAAREERARERESHRLTEEKDRTAAELKRLSSRSGVSPEERAEAEAAYRAALAAVIAAETGEAPAWAPPPEETPDDDTSEPSESEPAESEPAEPGSSDGEAASDPSEVPADGAEPATVAVDES